MKVSNETLELLKNYQNERDHIAYVIGLNTIKWLGEISALKEQSDKSYTEQRKLGEKVLQGLGLDIQANNYTIDIQTGDVKNINNPNDVLLKEET